MTSLLVEWSDPPRISGSLPKTVTGTWSQFRRLEDAGLVHRERELVIIEDGEVRAMYRIVASDELEVVLELEGVG